MSKLTAEAVDNIFTKCLFTDEEIKDLKKGEIPEGGVKAEGVLRTFVFHPQRLQEHKTEIVELLKEVAPEFHYNSGGGFTFLKLPWDKHDNHWGEHLNAEQLVVLGLAVRHVAYCLPRTVWSALPGGMPYLMINVDEQFPE